jgi:hypothetical protein
VEEVGEKAFPVPMQEMGVKTQYGSFCFGLYIF